MNSSLKTSSNSLDGSRVGYADGALDGRDVGASVDDVGSGVGMWFLLYLTGFGVGAGVGFSGGSLVLYLCAVLASSGVSGSIQSAVAAPPPPQEKKREKIRRDRWTATPGE